MAMIPKNVNDVFIFTSNFFKKLTENMEKSAQDTDDEQKSLVLQYLCDQEKHIVETLQTISKHADNNLGDTCFYLYTDRHDIVNQDPSELDFRNMDTKEIQTEISSIQEKLADLFRHISERAETNRLRNSTRELADFIHSYTLKINQQLSRAEEL